MWRSFFLAIGAYCCLLGVEALAVEKAVVKIMPTNPQSAVREVIPPDWAPWGLLACTMLGLAAGMYLLIRDAIRMNKD